MPASKNDLMPQKAIIFAAGLGSRLRPLTNDRPKALVEIDGIPLLEHAINKFVDYGVINLIINIHHFGDQIIKFLEQKKFNKVNITISDERSLLLDTGGALKKASWFFDDNKPFWAYNVDIITDIDLNAMLTTHLNDNAIATLAIRKRKSSRYLLWDQERKLKGWKNTRTGKEIRYAPKEENLQEQAFSGIHIIQPEIFHYLPDEKVFPIINTYLNIATEHTISGFNHDNSSWFDTGTPEKLHEAEEYIKKYS
ncbi:MAG: nucleotidyltransferase family protein [Bacteroidales bacterium]